MSLDFQNLDYSWVHEQNDSKNESLLFAQKIFSLLAKKHSVWLGADCRVSRSELMNDRNDSPSLFFRSGGTSGKHKWIRHDQQSLFSAVNGLMEHLGEESMSCWCCLPLNHVGGMMQIIRAASTGGKVFFFDYRRLLREPLESLCENQWISLVPTQLHRLIGSSVACKNLRKFRGIFVGGAAIPLRLAQKCRVEALPLFPSYGMSETAGMITLLDANSFRNGIEGVGNTLPHAQISVDSQKNCFLVKSKSMCLNSTEFSSMRGGWLSTPDYGYQDGDGNWFIQGRWDRTIITGGEKVNPKEIEQVLGQFESVRECVVYGVKDEEWGQRVVAYISPKTIKIQKLKDFAKRKLANHSIPKEWHLVEKLPLSAMGKPLN